MPGGLPKAIFFDLDDTILALSDSAEPCWRIVIQRFVAHLAGISMDGVLEAINRERRWYWSDPERHQWGRLHLDAARTAIVQRALLALGIEAPALAREIAAAFASEREQRLGPIPGAPETLQRLRDLGVRLALLTNGASADQRRKIEQQGLAPFFELILIEGELGYGKPDERVYRQALNRMGLAPEDVWMVGDNLLWDVGAPQALGITAIWIDRAGQGPPAGSSVRPDKVIASISELIPGLDRAAGRR
jgi:putative hydrolase of the HAD superfamily